MDFSKAHPTFVIPGYRLSKSKLTGNESSIVNPSPGSASFVPRHEKSVDIAGNDQPVANSYHKISSTLVSREDTAAVLECATNTGSIKHHLLTEIPSLANTPLAVASGHDSALPKPAHKYPTVPYGDQPTRHIMVGPVLGFRRSTLYANELDRKLWIQPTQLRM